MEYCLIEVELRALEGAFVGRMGKESWHSVERKWNRSAF